MWLIAGIFFVGAGLLYGLVSSVGIDRIVRKLNPSHQSGPIDQSRGEKEYPEINLSNASSLQKQIVSITKDEFYAQPGGTKYSEGVSEPWCADFVSWTLRQSGTPLKNPNSGGWRIPGTYTLLDFYKQNGRFREANSGYSAKLGDVALYRASPVFGDHANFVLKNDSGVLTTIGGNENGRIRVFVNQAKQYEGLLGYGVIE